MPAQCMNKMLHSCQHRQQNATREKDDQTFCEQTDLSLSSVDPKNRQVKKFDPREALYASNWCPKPASSCFSWHFLRWGRKVAFGAKSTVLSNNEDTRFEGWKKVTVTKMLNCPHSALFNWAAPPWRQACAELGMLLNGGLSWEGGLLCYQGNKHTGPSTSFLPFSTVVDLQLMQCSFFVSLRHSEM